MPILHKDLSRLARDAKKLRKYLKENFNHSMPTQKSLDRVASFFGWDNWNTLYLAHQKNTKVHTWWHDMRWREKINHIESQFKSESDRIGNMHLTDEDATLLLSITAWFKNQFSPPANLFDTKSKIPLSFFGKAKASPYRNIYHSRFREGIEFVCPDTLILTQHMKKHFLTDMGNPGLIIFCQPSEVMDFARMLKDQGYTTSMIADDFKLPESLNIETKALKFLTSQIDPNGPYGIDRYISSLTEHLPNSFRKNITKKYVHFIVKLRSYEADLTGSALPRIPTVNELINITRKHGSKKIRHFAKDLLGSIHQSDEENENAIQGNPSASYEEQWHYLGMQIFEQIKFIRERCYPIQTDDFITVNKINRLQSKEAILIPVPDNSYTCRQYLSIINDMLMDSFSRSSLLMGSDDIFVLATNTIKGTGPVTNSDFNLKFTNLNRARANTVFYGEHAYCDQTADTQIVVESPSRWEIKDLRKQRI